MSDKDEKEGFSAIGYVRYMDSCPAPVILVFGTLDNKLLQKYSHKGIVRSFSPMTTQLEERFQVWEDVHCRSRLGGKVQLAVEHPLGKLIVGNYDELPKLISKRLRTLNIANDCFAAFELAEISNDMNIRNKSAKYCVAKMNQISFLSAKDWINNNFSTPRDRKRLMKYLQDINRSKSADQSNMGAAENRHGQRNILNQVIDEEARELVSLALDYSYTSETGKAREIFKALVSNSPETPILMEAYLFFIRTNMLDDADAVAIQMIERSTHGSLESAIAHGNRVSVLVSKNHFDEAQKHLNIAVEIYNKNGDALNVGSLYGTVGTAYYLSKNYEVALEWMTKAHEINVRVGNKENIANDQNHFAMVYQQMGGEENLKKSLDWYKSAISLNGELIAMGYRLRSFNLGNNHGGIGLTYSLLDRLDVAREHWGKALNLFESVGAFDRAEIVKGYLAGRQTNEQIRH